jgi:tRNA(Arg) A34 adenosine deaminase TadA
VTVANPNRFQAKGTSTKLSPPVHAEIMAIKEIMEAERMREVTVLQVLEAALEAWRRERAALND